MKKLLYRVHLAPEPEGGYTVTVPALPGCVTWGKDYEHAMDMVHEAIEAYLEVLVEDGRPIPQDIFDTEIETLVQIETSAVA